jgi:two-component system phosphate regulon sensor histidine kinase PhoR
VLGVLVPVVLVSAAGIVALTLFQEVGGIVIGTLVVTGALASLGAAVAILVMLRRRSQLARQQVTFLTNVTHELRTPLAAIRLYAQTLEVDAADNAEQRRECSAAIVRESHRLEHLVNRVLEWRSIAEGKRLYAFTEGAVGPALHEAVDSFRAILQTGEVDLETDLSASATVRVDRAALAEAVLNLLVNAHKYSGDEKRISLVARDVGGGVEIAVRDTVWAHRGRIALSSEPGRGSTFTIFLPAAPSAAAPDRRR